MDAELKNYLDKQFETVATKDDLAQQTESLKHYADKQTAKLAVIINTTIVEPMDQNFSEVKDYKAVREEVSALKSDVQKIKTALQLN